MMYVMDVDLFNGDCTIDGMFSRGKPAKHTTSLIDCFYCSSLSTAWLSLSFPCVYRS